MARIVGAVEFKDGRRLYLVVDGTTSIAFRPLFDSEDAAREWADDSSTEFVQPTNAEVSEEPVEILMDLAFSGDQRFLFPSRASAKAKWLTGPRSLWELDEENDQRLGDGYGRPEEPAN